MGYRFSLYRITKGTYNKWKDLSKEEYHSDEKWVNFYKEVTQECVYFDTLKSIMRADLDNKLSSPFFTHDVDEEYRMWATISRGQFLYIIEEVRQKIIEWFDGRRVDGDKLGEEWNIKADSWKIRFSHKNRYAYANIDLEDKWRVSRGVSYEYLIFDLIHIYKIFDWENDVLLAIGD